MTRTEFDRMYAATDSTTEGYTAAQLAEINERVWQTVADLDVDHIHTKSAVDHAFTRAFAAQ